jgi:hypothetical protein
MTSDSVFGRFISAKILLWKAQIKSRRAMCRVMNHRQVVLIFFIVGSILGWIICSEWQIYLQTGKITVFPWG